MFQLATYQVSRVDHCCNTPDKRAAQQDCTVQGVALEALVEALQNEEEAQEIVDQARQVLHSCL